MKTLNKLISIAAIVATISCNQSENYSSVQDFYSRNGVPMQTYTINGTTGGSFTSPQGTIVSIPANAFINQSNVPITGDVTIQFKDIYKKSDMLLSGITTLAYNAYPLVSGGEFFFKVTYDNAIAKLANGKKVTVTQPRALTDADSAIMEPFIATDQVDSLSIGGFSSWFLSASDSIFSTTNNYVYNLLNFEAGFNWYNTDAYISGSTPTQLTLHPTDGISSNNSQVFIVLNTISSVVNLYEYSGNYIYDYAPFGMQCTIVSFGMKDGDLYSCFVPITVGANQTYNFSRNKTTTAEFKTQLEALN